MGDTADENAATLGAAEQPTSVGHSTGDSEAGPRRAARPALPFSLRLLLAYLVVDAGVELSWLAHRYFDAAGYAVTRDDLWVILIGSFYLLLVPQILVRSVAARVSLSVVFAVQIAVFLVNFGLQAPEEWSTASALGRFQEVGKLIFFSVFIVLLNRKPISETLRH